MDKTFDKVLEFINFINSAPEQVLVECFDKNVADNIVTARISYNIRKPYAYDFLKNLNPKSLADYMDKFKTFKENHVEKAITEYYISELVDLNDLKESDIICYYNSKYKIGDLVEKRSVFKVNSKEDDDYLVVSSIYNNEQFVLRFNKALNKFANVTVGKIFKCTKTVKEIITSELKIHNIKLSDLKIGDCFKLSKNAKHIYKLVDVKVPIYEPAQDFICALSYADSKVHFLSPDDYTDEHEKLKYLEYGDTFRMNNGSSSLMIKVNFSGGPYEFAVYNKQTYEVETMDNCEIIPIF